MARPTTTSMGRPLGTRTAGTPLSTALGGTVKVLCIGDSITFGYGAGAGPSWRAGLKSRFADIGLTTDFVGPISDGVSADPQHWGVPGARIADFVAGNTVNSYSCDLSTMGATYGPHLIIVYLGANDFAASSDGLASLASLMAILWTQASSARVTVCKPHRWTTAAYSSYQATYNAGVAATVAASSHGGAGLANVAETQRVSVPLVDTNIPTGELIDYIHPRVAPSATFGKILDQMWPTICNAVGINAQW